MEENSSFGRLQFEHMISLLCKDLSKHFQNKIPRCRGIELN